MIALPVCKGNKQAIRYCVDVCMLDLIDDTQDGILKREHGIY